MQNRNVSFTSQPSTTNKKYFQLFSNTNPINQPEFNFSALRKKTGYLSPEIRISLDEVGLFLSETGSNEIDWTSAVPMYSPPQYVRAAIIESGKTDNLHQYSATNGEISLKKHIAHSFLESGIPCDENNILIHIGTFEILKDIYSMIEWGEAGILIPAPTFGYYVKQANDLGIRVDLIHAKKENNWKIDPNELDTLLIKIKPKVFLFTNPVNPTGVVYSKEDLVAISQVLKRHNVLVISDEIFKDLLLTKDSNFTSIASIKDMANRCVTIHGLGKAMGMAGLRMSYACGPENIISNLPKILCGLPIPSEKAALSVFAHPFETKEYLAESIFQYQNNINYIKDKIKQINVLLNDKFGTDVVYVEPMVEPVQATNTYLISFKGLKGMTFQGQSIQSGLDLARFLLKDAGIAIVPGEGSFVDSSEISLRFITSADQELLELGFNKIMNSFNNLLMPLNEIENSTRCRVS